MSGNSARSVGRLAFTAVGYYVGGLVGAPAVGGAIGGAIGGALFPHQLPEAYGPRLDDLSIQTSSVGIAIPIVYGTYAIAGNVIWSAPIREVSETEEVGKGSGTEQDVTTYSYFGSFAVGLCEGEIAGITRIWANESLVYDIRPQQSGETTAEFNQRMAGSTAWAEYMTVYLGSETQEADPTIEAEEGAGNVPGYRGLAYIVFDGLPLGDFYNRFPQLKVEVVNDGEVTTNETVYMSNGLLDPWLHAFKDPRDSRNSHRYRAVYPAAGNGAWTASYADARTDLDASIDAEYQDAQGANGEVLGHSFARSALAALPFTYPESGNGINAHDYVRLTLKLNIESSGALESSVCFTAEDSDEFNLNRFNFVASFGVVYLAEDDDCGDEVDSFSIGRSGVYRNYLDSQTPPDYYMSVGPNPSEEVEAKTYRSADVFIELERTVRPPRNPCDGYPMVSDDYCVIGGAIAASYDWQYDDSVAWKALAKYDTASVDGLAVVISYPMNPARPQGHEDYDDEAFWTQAYQDAVLAGALPSGMTYSATGGGDVTTYPRQQSFGYRALHEAMSLASNPVGLSGVVTDLCARAGLVEIDVAALADDYIHGYAIGTVMAARDAIQPLRQYAQFDAAEVDGELRFVKRGGAAVATLTADDLGAYTGDQRPDPIAVERAQDVELPRRLRLHYASTDRDYEAGEQTAARLTTGAVNVHDIELPIAMSDTQAAQITEILLFDLWTARNGYRTTLATEHLALAPGDPVTLPVDGQQERARILSIDYAAPGVLALELARDDDGNYVSYAVGNAGSFRPGVVVVSGPTEVVLLDLPALLDADNNPGYYAAMRGLLAGWQGASLFRSNDGGGSYTAVASASNAATMGAADSALPDALATVWDRGNVLSVVLDSGELEGITESAVLAGGNAAALEVRDGDGATLGWEVLQFAEAAQESDGSWTLTDLLRGRKGTEWATGLHQAGDRFVLLTGPGIIRVPMESSGIGIERPHRAVTVGTSVDSALIVDFAGAGVALEPYSPVHVRGDWDGADLVLSWIRRGRIGNAYSSGTDIPLSEESESYEVDILAGESVLRTLASTAQSVTYTAAQQSEDWGSPIPDTFTVRVYQLSATVGRGYPAETVV